MIGGTSATKMATHFREVARGVPHRLVHLLNVLYLTTDDEELPEASWKSSIIDTFKYFGVNFGSADGPSLRDIKMHITHLNDRCSAAAELLDLVELKVQELQNVLADLINRKAKLTAGERRGACWCDDDEGGTLVEKINRSDNREKKKGPTNDPTRQPADHIDLRRKLRADLEETKFQLQKKDSEVITLRERLRDYEEEDEARRLAASGSGFIASLRNYDNMTRDENMAIELELQQAQVLNLQRQLDIAHGPVSDSQHSKRKVEKVLQKFFLRYKSEEDHVLLLVCLRSWRSVERERSVGDVRCEVHTFRSEMTTPRRVNVVLFREDGRGLGLSVATSDTSIIVTAIANQGLVAEWNAHHTDQKVEIGNSLVSVNGVSGDPGAMVSEIGKCGKLNLWFQG
eukprot:TRINITY_DN76390_c0_g1_i1.p1 TRINITY_DN76390_c0_g1~~TRINITY_DN76390_c0_g1_i1.p1  ORF type:complete len:449 (-),score=55.50 TRINITY_DN76390_c0_g1_i1:97-1296(-)